MLMIHLEHNNGAEEEPSSVANGGNGEAVYACVNLKYFYSNNLTSITIRLINF